MIVSSQTQSLGLPARVLRSRSVRTFAVREWAIDAACFVMSVAAAGVLSIALLAAAELPSVASGPAKAAVQVAPGGHS
jgi:hypothetical protein